MDKKILRMKKHYIVCGYGRIGRVLCQQLADTGIDLVVCTLQKKNSAPLHQKNILSQMV